MVFKNFPLESHKFAKKAATAALAAHRQGKFWEFHHKMFDSGAQSDKEIQGIAKELDLDLGKFNRDMNDPAIQSLITGDIQNGKQAGVRGTPTVFINGKLLGNRSLQGFEQMINAELKKKMG